MTALVPVPDRGFKLWHISEIYISPSQTTNGSNVPNVNDLVYDHVKGFFRVLDVRPIVIETVTYYVPTLRSVSALDMFPSANPIESPFTIHAYFDRQITPYRIIIGHEYIVGDRLAHKAIVFRGTDITRNGVIVSQRYGADGTYLGEAVPLETISPMSNAVKRVASFNTQIDLADGEALTLVVYSIYGTVLDTVPLTVVTSGAIRDIVDNKVYITDVRLLSQYLTSDSTLAIPANVQLSLSSFTMEIFYSDGTTAERSIDGTKARLYGLDTFVKVGSGLTLPLVATYFPDINEPCINLSNPEIPGISRIYSATALTTVDGNNFKIYIMPVYSNGTFSLSFYLTNLTYTLNMLIPPEYLTILRLDGLAPLYVPAVGKQLLTIDLNLANILGDQYLGVTHSQMVGVQVYDSNPSWTIDYNPSSIPIAFMQEIVTTSDEYVTVPTLAYVDGETITIDHPHRVLSSVSNYAIRVYNDSNQIVGLNLQGTALTYVEWIGEYYYASYPIFDTVLGGVPPIPTHFKIRVNDSQESSIYSIDEWNTYVYPTYALTANVGDIVQLVWLKANINNVYDVLSIVPCLMKN